VKQKSGLVVMRRIKCAKKENKIDPETKALEDELSDTLGTRVQIEKKDKGGKLVIDFFLTQTCKA